MNKLDIALRRAFLDIYRHDVLLDFEKWAAEALAKVDSVLGGRPQIPEPADPKQYDGLMDVGAYGALLKAGVEIHEYSASFLHAKVAVVDGEWATVGSSNLDPLSLLLAREANITAQGKDFAAELRGQLVYAMAHEGAKMDPAEYARRPLRKRCMEYIAFMAMRVALMFQGRKYL